MTRTTAIQQLYGTYKRYHSYDITIKSVPIETFPEPDPVYSLATPVEGLHVPDFAGATRLGTYRAKSAESCRAEWR